MSKRKPETTADIAASPATGRIYEQGEHVSKARQALRLAIDGKVSINDVILEHGAGLIEVIAAQEYGSFAAGRRALLDLRGLTRETSAKPALKFFKFWFHGRKQGAIGISYDQSFICLAAGEAEAREELASKFEVYHLKILTRAYRVTFEDGSTLDTEMNVSLEEATKSYLQAPHGFRLTYDESGPLLKAVKVEQI